MAHAKAPWLILVILAVAATLPAQTATGARPPYSLLAEVNLVARSTAPWIQDRWVVFTYRPTTGARYVALRFEHEDYTVLHPLALNEKKTYVLVYEPPAGMDRLTYRMSVDGMWMRDPANPDYTTDLYGTPYSRVDLSSIPAPEPVGPVAKDGEVTFRLNGQPSMLVTLAGTFNRWDPFVHVLDEVETGRYELTLRLPSGVYYYYFLSNGRKMLDPGNLEIRRSAGGELINAVVMP